MVQYLEIQMTRKWMLSGSTTAWNTGCAMRILLVPWGWWQKLKRGWEFGAGITGGVEKRSAWSARVEQRAVNYMDGSVTRSWIWKRCDLQWDYLLFFFPWVACGFLGNAWWNYIWGLRDEEGHLEGKISVRRKWERTVICYKAGNETGEMDLEARRKRQISLSAFLASLAPGNACCIWPASFTNKTLILHISAFLNSEVRKFLLLFTPLKKQSFIFV